MQFRLHIDIPLGDDEEEAIKMAKSLMHWHFSDSEAMEKIVTLANTVKQINYRLGHDEDRQKSNYLQKTDNGHITNKKTRLTFSD
tara:strand:- start:319 stop:573 length:255 start_codon:yes stop_codon:yes gene_type:complete